MPRYTRMSIDIETRSTVNLATVGVYNYAIHPDTEILCLAYAIENYKGETLEGNIIPEEDDRDALDEGDFYLHDEFLDAWDEEECDLYAFNESFERIMLSYCAGPKYKLPTIKYTRWHCTQAQSLYYNLPADLDTVGTVLPVKHKKDKKAKRIMLQLCKPRKPSKDDPSTWWHRKNHPEKYEILYEYCMQDVRAELAISKFLGPLPEHEKLIFDLDKEINMEGLCIDVEAVKKAQAVDAIYRKELERDFQAINAAWYKDQLDQMAEPDENSSEAYIEEYNRLLPLVQGLRPSQREKVQNYFNERYEIELTSMAADVVEKLLTDDFLDPTFRQELELRSQCTKASVAKINAVVKVMTPDNRFHGALQYYGAAATGRWAGRTFQPQNLPRGFKLKEQAAIFDDLLDLEPEDFIETYREQGVMTVLSGIIRGFIIPPKGYKMFMVDYSAIEARVVAWYGDVENDLQTFRDGKCVYREFTKPVFGFSDEKAHSLDSGCIERFICKTGVLSLGYGVGHGKFGGKIFEDTNGEIDIQCKCKPDPENPRYLKHTCEAKRIVNIYRETRPGVTHLWYEMETAVFNAMKNPGELYTAGPFKFIKRGPFLHMRLPNGRVLRYPNPELRQTVKWGKEMEEFTYRGKKEAKKTIEEHKDPDYNKNWRVKSMYGAKFFQNACQATARDIMAEAMLRVQRFKGDTYKITLTVHDEIVGVFKEGEGSLEEVEELMTINPDWAPDIPLKVEGAVVERYGK